MAYVTPNEVAAVLGVTPAAVDARYDLACKAATEICDDEMGRIDPLPDPLPGRIHQAALEAAVDLLRRPGAPFGYFATDVTIASIGADPTRRIKAYLRPYKQTFGVA